MNLPKVVTELVKAQNDFDSNAYANCFTDTAVVFDEGHKYVGRKEIEQWIAESNTKYKATIQPVGYEENGKTAILKAKTSGNFPGSPITLSYHLEIADGLISGLKFTG